MRIIDLDKGQEEYNDEIYDRRGRGRSRRADGTYMGYDGGVYDHLDHEGMMEELDRRERELERRERELERRQRDHERQDEMYRRGWFGERQMEDRYDGDGPYARRRMMRRDRYY